MVSFRQVEYRRGERAILSGLNLEVAPGETLVLLGRSGSGKTTALRLVNALLMPTGGEVQFEGRATAAWDAIRLRRRIGYVIQDAGLIPHFTVMRNAALVPTLEGADPGSVMTRCSDLLERVGLPAPVFGNRYPRQLSGGERQRVGLVRALAADPPLLLLDEPFGALDPITRYEVQNYFLELRRELRKTAIFVTHDVREALRLGTRIALLHEGRVELACSPEEFLRTDNPHASAFLESLRGTSVEAGPAGGQ